MLDETIKLLAELRFNIINRHPNGNYDDYTQKLLDQSSVHMRKLLEIKDRTKENENRKVSFSDLFVKDKKEVATKITASQ